MNLRRQGTVAVLLAVFSIASVFGQSGALKAPAGEFGLWVPPNAGDERLVDLDEQSAAPANPFAIETNPLQRTPRVTGGERFSGKLTLSRVPFQPWARALFEHRLENPLEPHTRCKASGGPRQFMTPYGVEFLELEESGRILIVDIGGPHTLRIIYTDGRPHPRDLSPSALGHSIGRWEDDTLVVDSIGFNEKFWMDRHGLPHTEMLHLIERFTRVSADTLQYEVTIDDPGAYTSTWTTGLLLRWSPGQEVFEYVCQDNNLAPQLMTGAATFIDRASTIVP
jgi:hypothetical protein